MQSISKLISVFLCAGVLTFSLLGAAFAVEKVNINTADADTLASALKGVGPAKAEAIVDYRQTHGPFQSADELASVKGIGDKLIEQNIDRIIVEGE